MPTTKTELLFDLFFGNRFNSGRLHHLFLFPPGGLAESLQIPLPRTPTYFGRGVSDHNLGHHSLFANYFVDDEGFQRQLHK